MKRRPAMLTEQEAYYLRSVLGNLRSLNNWVCEEQGGVSLQSEALADNIDFLDCFITARCPDCRKAPAPGCSQCWPAEMVA